MINAFTIKQKLRKSRMIPQLPFDSSAPKKFLSPAEFAAESGLSLSTTHRYIAAGRIIKWQPGGARCRILIPRSELDAVAPAAPAPQSAHSRETTSRSGPLPLWKRRPR